MALSNGRRDLGSSDIVVEVANRRVESWEVLREEVLRFDKRWSKV